MMHSTYHNQTSQDNQENKPLVLKKETFFLSSRDLFQKI